MNHWKLAVPGPFAIVLVVLNLGSSILCGQVLRGTISQVDRGTVTVMGPAGPVKVVTSDRVTDLRVFLPGKPADLPSEVDCYLSGSFVSSGSGFQAADMANLRVILEGSGPEANARHVMTSAQNGRTTVQNVPGLMKKTPAGLVFTPKGPVEYLAHGKDGRIRAGERRKDVAEGRSMTLPPRVGVEFEFGDDVKRIGKNATALVNGNPARPSRVWIERTEPIPPAELTKWIERARAP